MEFLKIFFYFFGSFVLLCSIFVIISTNPVHSILYLVLLFINGACLFLLLQTEFLGIIYLVVYVGAVAVLFLFVVMMLTLEDIKSIKFSYYFPINLITFFIFLLLCLFFFNNLWSTSSFIFSDFSSSSFGVYSLLQSHSNLEILGNVIFTYFFILFFFCALILLIGMFGAIFLTNVTRSALKKQNIFFQQLRTLDIYSKF